MKLSQWKKGLLAAILIPLAFQWNLIANITKPLSLLHGDAFLVNFILKHYMQIAASGNFKELLTLPMFYGFTGSLLFSDHHLIQAVLALPIYAVTQNIITTSNVLVVLTIVASSVSMFLLAWHFTKNAAASIIASIIFTLNPFVFARYPDQLILFSLQWIPLIFLFFEKSLENPKSKNTFLFFLFLTFQLLSSLYYSVFLTVILPAYIAIRLWQEKKLPQKFLNIGTIIGLVLFLSVTISSIWLYKQAFDSKSIGRNIEQSITYSAWPTDWLFTSQFNMLYGNIKTKASKAAPAFVGLGIYSEHNLFWGITPIIIFILSFKYAPKSQFKKLWVVSLLLLVFSFLMSLGPQIHLKNNLSITGPYRLVHALDPLFAFLRTPARFGVFVFFFLALISTITVSQYLKKLKPRVRILIGILIIFLILLEYWNKPLEFIKIDNSTLNFYQTLNNQKDIKVIVDLPIGNLIPSSYPQARIEDLDAHYLLYASILHNKKLFNGYTGFLPPEYYQRANYLSINFPTITKLKDLKSWGVDGIILHRDEFNLPSEYDQIKAGLTTKGIKQISTTNNMVLFDLTNWKAKP